ncbi:MAG: GAF domain-containing protein [Anaerolineales bacterium]|nr:GAF domain-containing protein [Anaerolineales bacterium]
MPEPLILFVDPARKHLPALEPILTREGRYRLSAPPSLPDALKELENSNPRIALLAFPGGAESLDAATRIRAERPGLPIILLLGKSVEKSYADVLRVRADEWIADPVDPAALLAALDRHSALGTTSPLHVRVRELETLSQLAKNINSQLDLDQALASIVEAAVRLTGAEEGSLMLVDPASGELYMRASKNFDEEFVRTFRMKMEDSLAGEVIRKGEPILLDGEGPRKIKSSFLVHSLIFVPLLQQGKTIGLLGVDNRAARRPLHESDLALMQALAEHAVIALENARLLEATRAQMRQLETVIQQVEDGVIITDTEGRMLIANRTVRALFHLDDSPLAGRPLKEVFPNLELQYLFARRESPLAKQRRTEITLADDRVYNAHLTPIEGVGYAIVLNDITQLKELDRLKSEFVATVSHDLRSPLTTILGYVDLIERAGPVTDQQKTFIRRIQNSVGSITTLISDLLDLGKIESGIDSQKEAIQLNAVARAALDGIRGRVDAKQIRLEVSLDESIPALNGNPLRLRQMVANLLDNAVKYTPEGGRIGFTTRREEGQAFLQVSDSGIGIPPNELPHVFNKFYRASNVQNTAGTGLGLSIVKSIAEIHGGRVWVDSTGGMETKFTVVLPLPKE